MNNETGREMEVSEGRATIVDVARRAGVSKSTVSLVLGGSSLVAETTRERVSDAMNELGYIYHRGAATLRGAKSGVIGMVINDLSNPFYVELAIGIEQACQGGAFIPFLANTAENPVRQQQVIRSMREHGAAGLVLAPAIGTSRERAEAPSCRIARRPGDAPPSGPQGLLRRAGEQGRRAKGDRPSHRRRTQPCRLCRRHVSSMLVREERLAGYRLALDEAGIALDPSLVIETTHQLLGRRDGGRRSCSTSPSPRPPLFASTTSSRSGSPAR